LFCEFGFVLQIFERKKPGKRTSGMPLSKKEEDTLREVLSSLLKVDDSAVTRVLEVLGPNLDSLTGTSPRGGGHKSLMHLTHLIQKVNKNTQVERVIKRNIPTPLTIQNKNVREDPRLFKFSCGRGRKKTSKIGLPLVEDLMILSV
jgi:hypothetical protein